MNCFLASIISSSFFFLFILLLLCLLSSSCGTVKNLKTDEILLNKNTIVLQSDKRIRGKRGLKYELSTIIKQQPNSRFLWLFKTSPLGSYYKIQNKILSSGDTTKWNKWVNPRQLPNRLACIQQTKNGGDRTIYAILFATQRL